MAVHDDDPASILSVYEQRARVFETPCGDGSMVWHAWGSGPPLVLAHGSHGSWSHWIRNIDALAAHHTIWVPDLPGFGASADPPQPANDAVSAVLAAGIRELIAPQLPLDAVGFSYGGVALAFMAGSHPGLVRRLVLIGTGGLGTPVGEVKLQGVRGLDGAARAAVNRSNLLGLMLHAAESVDPLALHLQAVNGRRGRLNVSAMVLPDKLVGALGRVRVPVHAIWGEFDRPHPDPPAQEAVLRRFNPDMEFRVIPGAGHWAMYERPEAFNAALLAILDRECPGADRDG